MATYKANTVKPVNVFGWPLGLETTRRLLSEWRADLTRRHAAARRRARSVPTSDLLAWGKTFLPQHFHRPPSLMHRWLAARLQAAQTARGVKLNVLGPRGSAKSTIATLALPLRAALEGSEPYIWIICDTKAQAAAHLENIKAELLENPLLAAAYPACVGRGPVWRATAVVLRNGARIEAFGAGQRLRGRRYREHRPTLIICDDLQNDGHIRSPDLREQSRNWFHAALMKAGASHTNIINLATALHRDCLAMELHRTPGWISRRFAAILRWPENMALWQQWEEIYTNLENPHYKTAAAEFYRRHRAAMEQGAVVLWPEAEDLYSLMCMRAESGRTAFEREKQNSPLNPELCEWPEAYFAEPLWFDLWPENLVVRVLALDPSKGVESRRGDYSALVALGVDRQGFLYVDADLARRPTPEMVAESVEWYCRFRFDAFGVEANQFQELLAGEFLAEFRRRGLLTVRPALIENRVPKPVRIRRLGPYLAVHRIRFRSGSRGTRVLVEQLRDFPLADHDDGPDALEMAVRMASEILHGRTACDGLGNRLPVG